MPMLLKIFEICGPIQCKIDLLLQWRYISVTPSQITDRLFVLQLVHAFTGDLAQRASNAESVIIFMWRLSPRSRRFCHWLSYNPTNMTRFVCSWALCSHRNRHKCEIYIDVISQWNKAYVTRSVKTTLTGDRFLTLKTCPKQLCPGSVLRNWCEQSW